MGEENQEMVPRLVATFALLVCLSAAQEKCSTQATAVVDARRYITGADSFKLTYFDGRGLAEVSRTLLATTGRFPGEGFVDVRLSRDQFNEKKGAGDLARNLNRVPLLNHNGQVIGQSGAIGRYLAKQLGMFGANDAEAAQIDAICEHMVDIKAAFRAVAPYGAEVTPAAHAIWFDTPASPELGGRKERQLRWFLDQVVLSLGDDGYSVGGRPSLADAYFYNMLGEHAAGLGGKGEPFGNMEATVRVLSEYPKLLAVVNKFGSSPGMKFYLGMRGEMKF